MFETVKQFVAANQEKVIIGVSIAICSVVGIVGAGLVMNARNDQSGFDEIERVDNGEIPPAVM